MLEGFVQRRLESSVLFFIFCVTILVLTFPETMESLCSFMCRLKLDMGRKSGGLYINPKKFGAVGKPCMKEMLSFLSCLSLNKNNDDKCVRQKDMLLACVDAQVRNRVCHSNFTIL